MSRTTRALTFAFLFVGCSSNAAVETTWRVEVLTVTENPAVEVWLELRDDEGEFIARSGNLDSLRSTMWTIGPISPGTYTLAPVVPQGDDQLMHYSPLRIDVQEGEFSRWIGLIVDNDEVPNRVEAIKSCTMLSDIDAVWNGERLQIRNVGKKSMRFCTNDDPTVELSTSISGSDVQISAIELGPGVLKPGDSVYVELPDLPKLDGGVPPLTVDLFVEPRGQSYADYGWEARPSKPFVSSPCCDRVRSRPVVISRGVEVGGDRMPPTRDLRKEATIQTFRRLTAAIGDISKECGGLLESPLQALTELDVLAELVDSERRDAWGNSILCAFESSVLVLISPGADGHLNGVYDWGKRAPVGDFAYIKRTLCEAAASVNADDLIMVNGTMCSTRRAID